MDWKAKLQWPCSQFCHKEVERKEMAQHKDSCVSWNKEMSSLHYLHSFIAKNTEMEQNWIRLTKWHLKEQSTIEIKSLKWVWDPNKSFIPAWIFNLVLQKPFFRHMSSCSKTFFWFMLGLSLMGPKVIKETISCLPCSSSTDLKGPKWLVV